MRVRLSAWRTSLSAALGLAAVGCGGQSLLDGDERGGDGGSSSVTGGSGGSAGSTGGSGGSAGSTGGVDLSCQNPTPILAPDGSPTGFVRCDGGYIHRTERHNCPSSVPRPIVVAEPGDAGITCSTDADCADLPYGHCTIKPPLIMWGGGGTQCTRGCVVDEECEPGSVCLCGDPVGTCVSASCTTDADCGDLLCTSIPGTQACGEPFQGAFACQTPRDACRGVADCGGGVSYCQSGPTGRACQALGDCGRPFLVEGEARLARVVEDESGWRSEQTPDLRALDPKARAALAEHFARLGLMEHASVAAFARFTLELLSLGAPSELVTLSQRALGDEIRHAELCFGLATAYAGRALGPGPLSSDGALASRSFETIVDTAIAEACIGETLAAVEAAEAAEQARDPAVRAALFGIAEDERRHAELGWRFLRWALETADGATRERLLARLDDAVALAPLDDAVALARIGQTPPTPTPGANADPLLAHGVLTPELRRGALRAALDELVAPLARDLAAQTLRRAA